MSKYCCPKCGIAGTFNVTVEASREDIDNTGKFTDELIPEIDWSGGIECNRCGFFGKEADFATKTTKLFHFNLGNSNKNAIGYCCAVRAQTEEQAVEILKDAICARDDGSDIDLGCAAIDYMRIYFNPHCITVDHIDAEEDE